jgi:hypothetical protein
VDARRVFDECGAPRAAAGWRYAGRQQPSPPLPIHCRSLPPPAAAPFQALRTSSSTRSTTAAWK